MSSCTSLSQILQALSNELEHNKGIGTQRCASKEQEIASGASQTDNHQADSIKGRPALQQLTEGEEAT